MINKEQIVDRLKTIKYPGFSRDIVSFGIVKDLSIQDSNVKVSLNFTSNNPEVQNQVVTLVKEQLESMMEVKKVDVDVTIQPSQKISHAPGDKDKMRLLTNIKYKIAVASGKGGVGKSTVAVNIALALAQKGARVGLMDADIYGPNIPMMMGTSERPKGVNNKVLPIEKYGIKLISIGFFLRDESPIIWRGPLVGKAIEQLMRDIIWEDIDYFIVDMPPGTGDAQLSLSSLIDLSGSVIVTTPQDVALADAIKGVLMFQKVDVGILGIVENMSYFICPHCGEKTDIFSHGGAAKACANMKIPFLGEVPLNTDIRIGGDTGKPIVVTQPDSPQAKAFFEIADKLVEELSI